MNNIKPLLYYFCLSFFILSHVHGDDDTELLDTKRRDYTSAVTYDLGGGRFGDQCLAYLHAKWISYKYNIPLLYLPFSYSDQLALHQSEKQIHSSDYQKFEQVIYPKHGMNINYERDISALYVIPYFPDALWEHSTQDQWYYFPVNWQDQGFKKIIRNQIKPINFQPRLEIPKDRISLAVHVRLGGGFDSNDTWKRAPLKLPPISFYKDQIRRISEILNHEPLYVFVFTDDKNPGQLVNTFYENTRDLNIQYDYRSEGNAHDSNVLEDFFEMTRFDCLIRPQSNYSIVISKIANFAIVISPTHFTWLDSDNGYVDEVLIEY